MSNYKWKGYELVFNSQEETHQKITRIFTKHKTHIERKFIERYKSVVKGTDDNAIITMSEFALDIYDAEIKLVKEDVRKESLYIRIDVIASEYDEDVFQSINQNQIEMLKIYYDLKGVQNQKAHYREMRKDDRGHWIGGGFGIRGAIKGVVEAKLLDVATGTAHTAINALGNFGTLVNINSKINRLIYDNGRDAMINSITYGLSLIYWACLEAKKVKNIYTDEMFLLNQKILEQYKKANDAFRNGKLFMNIKNFPYNSEQYEVLSREYGDQDNILKNLGANCGIDIEAIKKKILVQEM